MLADRLRRLFECGAAYQSTSSARFSKGYRLKARELWQFKLAGEQPNFESLFVAAIP